MGHEILLLTMMLRMMAYWFEYQELEYFKMWVFHCPPLIDVFIIL